MTRFYLFLFALAAYSTVFGQTEGASKLYGYKQKVQPGTIRVNDDGRKIQKSPQDNYLIYLVSNTLVKPYEIWINGEAYVPIVTKVTITPINHVSADARNQPTLLVPKTNKNVLQVSPSLKKIEKPSEKGRMLSAENELVVIYAGTSKIHKPYYKAIAKLNELDPLDMQ